MNINIEKIENGYVVTIGSKKHFCDVPEVICGIISEWVLEECKRIENAPNAHVDQIQYLNRYAEIAQQNALAQAHALTQSEQASAKSTLGARIAKSLGY